jgi:hypothetical protein
LIDLSSARKAAQASEAVQLEERKKTAANRHLRAAIGTGWFF